jgi:hypothetical protein
MLFTECDTDVAFHHVEAPHLEMFIGYSASPCGFSTTQLVF